MNTRRIYIIQDIDRDAICWTTNSEDIGVWLADHPLAEIVNIEMSEVVFYYTVEFTHSYTDE